MQRDTAPDRVAAIAFELRTWRTRALNVLLIVVTVIGLPALAFHITDAVRHPEYRPAVLIFLAVYLFLVALAVLRHLDLRLRAWGLMLLGYAAGVLAFARGGLAGEGTSSLSIARLRNW